MANTPREYTVTLDTKHMDYHSVSQWLDQQNIEYLIHMPYGRDYVYVFIFEDRNSAALFSLRYADYMLDK